ncbi:MAG: DNA adenine methylase [Candidatus Cloacimonetes bacterium]|nr:DNA adenine methylase [Candidatus Cloacimonadota bacterium]
MDKTRDRTVSTLTINIAHEISSCETSSLDRFIENALPYEKYNFCHYNFFYTYPEFGKKWKNNKDMEFHRLHIKCEKCGAIPDRNYAGVGDIYLIHNNVTNGRARMRCLCRYCAQQYQTYKPKTKPAVKSKKTVTPEVQTEKTVLAETEKKSVPGITDKNNCNCREYYPGQKNIEGVYQKIINEIPECNKFIELFAGTGAISKIIKKHAPATKVICNDINPDVAGKINFTDYIVTALDAISYLKNNQDKLNNDDFIFLDPPYHPSTRPNSLNLYKYELSIQDHEQLILSVLKLKNPIMIIHPECDLYDDNLILENGWRFVDLKIRYHNKTSHERLYMNYPTPQKLLISIRKKTTIFLTAKLE